jgi:ABC-type transport system involved in multi-copper enzyme maturation permease subunit
MIMTGTVQGRIRPSWFSRFWAIVRYEMLWNVRKKKFIGILIIAFIFATLSWVLPVVISVTTDQPIAENPEYAVSFTIPAIIMVLFAIMTAINSISSEFESGTIIPLLTKPVSRTMVFLGKLLAAFIIILITYSVLYIYTLIGGLFVYGAQNNLQLVPLALIGNVVSTFIWIAIIFAAGALSKSTIVSALVALGFFIALLFAVPVVATLAGPSPALNYFPSSGTSGIMNSTQRSISINAGTDSIGTNLINFVLYPSANVDFNRTSIQIVGGQPEINQVYAYTEPLALIVSRSVGVAVTYILVPLFIAWYALKRAEILE